MSIGLGTVTLSPPSRSKSHLALTIAIPMTVPRSSMRTACPSGVANVSAAGVVLHERVWSEEIARDHPEIALHKHDALHAVTMPDHVAADPDSASRKRFYLRGAGPSRWLL